jgi:DNA-binding CsgD family transcriptional regulator
VAGRYFSEAIGMARNVSDHWRLSHILGQQAQVAFVAGDPLAVRAAAEEGRDLADAIGDGFNSRQCRWRLAGAYLFEGDLTRAIAEYRAVVADADADHDVMSQVAALMILPHALAFHGEAGAARLAAESGIEAATELGDVYLGGIYISLMTSHLAAGDIASASDAADAGWPLLSSLYGTASINSAYIAQLDLARGNLAAARRGADEAAEATAGWIRGWVLTIRARIAIEQREPEQAERDAYEALACFADLKAYLGASNTFEILADIAGSSGSHREAARLYGGADGIRQRTGEIRLPFYQAAYDSSTSELRNAMGHQDFEAAWAEGAALSTSEAIAYAQRGRGERKRPSSGWASLTPTELDVVRLVSEGLGNKDIAARLFVSPRTVQSHLTRVYTKVGLSSRVQLAQEATRRSPATNG